MKSTYEYIRQQLSLGNVEEALTAVNQALSEQPDDSVLHYLRGTIYMKSCDWQLAMNAFLRSEELDKEGPAVEARQMLSDIMDFYYKDMYNP